MIRQLTVGFLAVASMASAQEKAPTLAEARAEFQKHDQALNRVYGELKGALRPTQFAVVKEDQRGWLDYRDYVAEGQARFEGKKADESADYWDMAAGMTEARLRYLKAWKGVGERGSWTGEYSDGRGGWLKMVETKEGLYFTLEVVRGPSFHLGVLGGKAEINEHMARFSIPLEFDKEEKCWISFLNDLKGDGRIQVVTANSHEFHGARAYFDNAYLRVGLLAEAEQAKVIKAAKAGGMLEE